MSGQNPILEMQNVEKHFGGVRAIDNFSLQVMPGMIYGLIGPNGAGKTTIFNTITGIYKADAGKIFFEGKEITNIKPHEAAEAGCIPGMVCWMRCCARRSTGA